MKMFFLLYVGLSAWVSSRSCRLGETPRPHTLISPSHGSPFSPGTQRGQLPAKLQEHFCNYLPQTKLFLRPKTNALMSLYSTRTRIQPPKKTCGTSWKSLPLRRCSRKGLEEIRLFSRWFLWLFLASISTNTLAINIVVFQAGCRPRTTTVGYYK